MRVLVLLMATLVWFQQATLSLAAVTSLGDIVPTPDEGGGSISGTLSVGEGAVNGKTFIGIMTIDGGSILSSGDGIVGNRLGATGTVIVTRVGSQWLNSDDVFIGNDGYGELYISDQGWVGNNDDFSIGFSDNGRGWVDVDGFGTILDVVDA